MADKELKNVKCLVEIRVKGVKVKVDEVVSKDTFNHKGDWLNLVHMKPARLEETDEPVGKPAVKESTKPADPATNKAAMPGSTK